MRGFKPHIFEIYNLFKGNACECDMEILKHHDKIKGFRSWIREAIIWKFSLKATREDMLVLDIGYSTSFRLGVKLPPNSLE